MNSELLQAARQCRLYKAALKEFANRLPASDEELDAAVADLVDLREEQPFTVVTLAAVLARRRVDARHLVAGGRLFENVGHLIDAAWHMSGDVAGALVQAVQEGRMGFERDGVCLIVAAGWCRRNAPEGEAIRWPPQLASQCRLFARRAIQNPISEAEAVALAKLVDDENLAAIIGAARAAQPPGLVETLIDAMIDEPSRTPGLHLPDRPEATALSGYTVRRAAARVGRNDPCPCGSGKKYKRCCFEKDQKRLLHSSEVPGLTVQELAEHAEAHLTPERLRNMRSHALAKLDPHKISPELRPLFIEQLLGFREHDTVVEILENLVIADDLADSWAEAIDSCAVVQREDLVRRLLKLRQVDLKELNTTTRLLLADPQSVELLGLMDEQAAASLNKAQPVHTVDLAYALLESRFPSLGILVARGALVEASAFDAMFLSDALLEARDKLNLSSNDPIEDLLEQRYLPDPEELDHQALAQATQALESKVSEVHRLRDQLAHLERDIERRERLGKHQSQTPKHPASTEPRADEQTVAELRAQLNRVKSDLKERHTERNQLRQELRAAHADLEQLKQNSHDPSAPDPEQLADAQEEDQLLTEDLPSTQPVRLPEFPRKFSETLASLPKTVAAAALVLIGRLAAGDSTGFRGTRRLKLRPDIWRQRVGRSYRLLFRLQEDRLEIVDLVPRRDLERRLRSL